MTVNVLLSSAGRRVSLLRCFRNALARLGVDGRVLAVDMSPLSSAFHEADRAFVVPACDDPAFIPEILRICQEQSVRLLVPTIDPELMAYARNRERFAEIGTVVAISPPEVIAIGSDKAATHRWLREARLPTPRQEVLTDPQRVAGWRYPVIVKPRRGSAGKGIRVVPRPDQLPDADRGTQMVVQEFVTGDEFTIDVLAGDRGRCLCAVPRRRLEIRGGEVSKGVTVRAPDLLDLARRVCATLPGAFGALNVQVIRDGASGDLRVIELNPRFGGGFPLSERAGAPFPLWMIQQVLGRPLDPPPHAWRAGVVMLRYDEAVFVDEAIVTGLRT